MFRALLAHLQEALHKKNWYIVCVLCRLAATRVRVSSIITLVAANRHNTHAIYQMLFVQRLLKMSK
jgi:hypothetical protein